MLDELCALTGWNRDHARTALRQARKPPAPRKAPRRAPLYGEDLLAPLEFINHNLFSWCADKQVTFTRSRPWRKNDNCFVEQKNWAVVRRTVGYLRYDTPAELRVLERIYWRASLYVNFFQPQMKLVGKTRRDAKVSRRYDTPRTPYRRLLRQASFGVV